MVILLIKSAIQQLSSKQGKWYYYARDIKYRKWCSTFPLVWLTLFIVDPRKLYCSHWVTLVE